MALVTKKSPAVLVKEQFGDKAKLVAAVRTLAGEALWISRENADKGLDHVASSKLLRLHQTFTTVAAKFGTRDKLIEAICEGEKRAADKTYRGHFAEWPVPRLWDHYKAVSRRNAAKDAPKPVKKAVKVVEAVVVKKVEVKKANPKAAKKGKKK